jgi:hypothetical protein
MPEPLLAPDGRYYRQTAWNDGTWNDDGTGWIEDLIEEDDDMSTDEIRQGLLLNLAAARGQVTQEIAALQALLTQIDEATAALAEGS